MCATIATAAAEIETETAIAETAIAIATFGVMVRGIRAATDARAARIPGTTAMNRAHAGPIVPPNLSATPASGSSRLGKSMRPALTRERVPPMKASAPPTSAASAVNGAGEAGADEAEADVTAGKTRRMVRRPTKLKGLGRSTVSLTLLRQAQATLRRRPRPRPLMSVRPSVLHLNRFVSSHP